MNLKRSRKKRVRKGKKIIQEMRRMRRKSKEDRLKCLNLSLMMSKKKWKKRMVSNNLRLHLGYLTRLLLRIFYNNKLLNLCNSDAIMIVVSNLHNQQVVLLRSYLTLIHLSPMTTTLMIGTK